MALNSWRHTLRPQAGLLFAALLGLLLPLAQAQAQDYPTRAVKIIVPFAPGGSADVFGRFIAQRLQETLGQSFGIDNCPGGGSVIGPARSPSPRPTATRCF